MSLQGKRIIKYLLSKMASSRENGLSETHASMLHAFCACNYIRLPPTRQHKTSVSVSRFAPLRHFQYKTGYNAFALHVLKILVHKHEHCEGYENRNNICDWLRKNQTFKTNQFVHYDCTWNKYEALPADCQSQ